MRFIFYVFHRAFSLTGEIMRKYFYIIEMNNESLLENIDKVNVYKLLHPKLDINSINNRDLIIRYYQMIPKYYLLSSDNNVLVYNAKTGSGKSITAVNLFIDLFHTKIANKRINDQNEKIQLKNIGNIYVISVWSGINQIINELFRPEFGFIDKNTQNELQKIKSNIPEEREKAYVLKSKLTKKLNKIIHFFGYQSFYNYIFNKTENILIQDINELLALYNRHNITISENIKNELRNSIIIVDEMHNLYSSDGLNTYGFAIMLLSKFAKELNLKILLMSGTVFNNSSKEIIDVLNIIRSEYDLLKYDDFIENILINNTYTYNIKKSKLSELISLYKNRYIFYNPAIESKKYEIKRIKDIKNIYIYHDDNNENAIVLEPLPDLPQEIYIGSRIISDKNDIIPFITYQCITYGKQSVEYSKYIKKPTKTTDSSDKYLVKKNSDETVFPAGKKSDEKESVSIKDAYIPLKNKIEEGIIKTGNLYTGEFLKLKNLKNYSTIGYNITKMVIENARHSEKTVIYHHKLNDFGIYQYGKILSANGCVFIDEKPRKDSICMKCGNTLYNHELSIDEKIKFKCCNHFTPIIYAYLTGEQTEEIRDNIKNKYNSRLNLFGQVIDVLFISNVAYSGISLLNTNNLAMISFVSNISKWKQIAARIVRTKSHLSLPENKQIAKIYTFVINHPEEVLHVNEKHKEINRNLGKFSFSESYYKANIEQNKILDDFVLKLSKECIGNTLFNSPEKYKPNDNENKTLNRIFINDIHNNISLIASKLFNNTIKTWSYETFIKRLKDSNAIYSYDLSLISENYLKNIINLSKNIEIFEYTLNNNANAYINIDNNSEKSLKEIMSNVHNTKYVRLTNDNIDSKVNNSITTFSFDNIYNTNADPATFSRLINDLENSKKYSTSINILQKIMKYIRKRFELLTNYEIIWNAMYDIHNEHYPTDDKEFFKNHHSKSRNKRKMDGFYYGDYIIYKNGSSKLIDYEFPDDIDNLKNIPYLFRLSSRTQRNNSDLFYIHLIIITKNSEEKTDKRRLIKGTSCDSYDTEKLLKYFPSIGIKTKNEYCRELMQFLIDLQCDNQTHFVYSPYEK